jgi:hypothetical protein
MPESRLETQVSELYWIKIKTYVAAGSRETAFKLLLITLIAIIS